MTTAAKLEEVYTDFLTGMARRACERVGSSIGIYPSTLRRGRWTVVGAGRTVPDKTTLADALYALLTDLGAHPPERVTEEEVRAALAAIMRTASIGVEGVVVSVVMRGIRALAASDDPRERLMAASILVVGT